MRQPISLVVFFLLTQKRQDQKAAPSQNVVAYLIKTESPYSSYPEWCCLLRKGRFMKQHPVLVVFFFAYLECCCLLSKDRTMKHS